MTTTATITRPPVRHSRPLTARETQVLTEASYGWTNQEIAARLYLSEATVKAALTRIGGILKIHTRTGMVSYALRAGLIR